MGFCFPECVMHEGDSRDDITIFDKMRAFLSGLKPYQEYNASPNRESR
jgi:hypothetical protein